MKKVTFWGAVALYLCLVIRHTWNPDAFAQRLAAVGIVAAVIQAGVSYGWKSASALLLICLVITFPMENVGAATGFPFGHYHFLVAANLPHVGRIPIIVGPLWFGMGYYSWVVAATILGGADRKLASNFTFIALPLVAAFVMTQWDVVMDPPEATLSRAWVWHDGGADFGVPLTNYLGWLLTSWLFFSAFAFYFRFISRPRLPAAPDRTMRLLAILLYVSTGLTHVTPYLMGPRGKVTDPSGHIWVVGDLREATVVTLLFTMVFTSLLAAIRLAEDSSQKT